MAKLSPNASLPLLFTFTLMAGALQAAEGDAPAAQEGNGKSLLETNCIKCHGSEVYTRPDRKVSSRDGLERQVRRCETALQLTWFDEDIANVAGYLNQQYYHFK
jgi:mono/diheme cytochrome c family protein